ncbi:MAG: NUDIX hydrolase [Dehalococcoidales bacterium]
MTEERTISSKQVFDGRAVRLRVDTVLTADGRRSTREIVEHSDCIGVVAIDEDDNVLLVRQYRKAIEKALLEIPAGGVDPGETPEEAVVREMQEETGYKPGRLERLAGFYSSPGFLTEYLHLYLATELTPSRLHAEDTAGISLVRIPVAEIEGMLAAGTFEDGKSIVGLRILLDRRRAA